MIRSVLIAIMLSLVLFLTAASAEAQILTLDDCIDLALKNRASIIIARGAENFASARQRAALGAFLPKVDASFGYRKSMVRNQKIEDVFPTRQDTLVDTTVFNGTNYESLVLIPSGYKRVEVKQDDLDRTSKSLNLQASISIFDPARLFDYKAAGASRKGAHLDVINSEQDLIYSVKGAYYSYLAAVENVSVQEQAVERSAEQLKLIQSKYDLGSASKSDVLKQKVQYGNDKLTLLSAQNSAITTRATLAYTVGVDPGSNVEFATEYTVRSYNGSLQDAIAFGLEYEPGLLSAQRAIDATRNSVKARKSDYLPKVIGFGSVDWSDGSSGFTATGSYSARTTTVGFSATWSIFDGFSRESRLTSAKVNRANAMAGAADTRNLVVSDIKTAYLEIEQRKQQQQVAEENVAASEEDMKITQEKYNLGAATILDLLNAQVSLKTAQVSKIRADFELNTAVAKLENAMGKM